MGPEIMSAFVGSWKLSSSENFDEYLKAIGIGMIQRKMVEGVTPVQEVTVNGNNFVIKTITKIKNSEIAFTLDTEFEETTLDDRKVKSTVTLVGDNKLVQVQKPTKDGEEESEIVREIDGDIYTMTLTAKGVSCTRKYKKQ